MKVSSRRRVLLAIAVAVCCAAGVGTAVVTRAVESKSNAAAETHSTAVTAPVQVGPLLDSVNLNCSWGSKVHIKPRYTVHFDDGRDAVVTDVPVKVGSTVNAGARIAEVSGDPVFALQGLFPSYRPLEYGMVGKDVRQLNTALAAVFPKLAGLANSPSYSQVTAQAVTHIYRQAGYLPPARVGRPAGSVFPQADFIFVPSFPATVEALDVEVGDPVQAALVTFAAGSESLACPLDDLPDQRLLDLGSKLVGTTASGVKIRFASLATATTTDDATAEASVPTESSLGPGKANQGGTVLRFSGPSVHGKSELVSIILDKSPTDTVIVPASAIWSDSPTVTKVTTVDSVGAQVVVDVVVALSVDGQVAVRPAAAGTTKLKPGVNVLVAKGS